MKLSDKQALFAQNFAELILWCFEAGFKVTVGEVFRTKEQQEIYVKEGKSKTINSAHMNRLAGDLNLFINGEYKTDRDSYKPLAEHWKSLCKGNVTGYDFGWDANHFELDINYEPI